MTVAQKDYRLAFSIMMAIVGFVMLGWAIPYGIANYKWITAAKIFRLGWMLSKAKLPKPNRQLKALEKRLTKNEQIFVRGHRPEFDRTCALMATYGSLPSHSLSVALAC